MPSSLPLPAARVGSGADLHEEQWGASGLAPSPAVWALLATCMRSSERVRTACNAHPSPALQPAACSAPHCACCCGADEMVYDAVLLLDRVMSIPLKVADSLLGVAMAACLLVAAKQASLADGHLPQLVSTRQPCCHGLGKSGYCGADRAVQLAPPAATKGHLLASLGPTPLSLVV